MSYLFTIHAQERMLQRVVTHEALDEAVTNPDQIWYDIDDEKLLIKKIFYRNDKPYLLMIAARVSEHTFIILTALYTSKIKKYL